LSNPSCCDHGCAATALSMLRGNASECDDYHKEQLRLLSELAGIGTFPSHPTYQGDTLDIRCWTITGRKLCQYVFDTSIAAGLLRQPDRRCNADSNSHLPLAWFGGPSGRRLLHSLCMLNLICYVMGHKYALCSTGLCHWLGNSWHGYAND